MDEKEIQKRHKILEDIKTFVDNTEKEILFILQSLGWSEQHIRNELSKRSECPFDPSHLIGSKNMNEHIKNCKTGRKRYNSFNEPFPNNCNNNESSTIVIDAKLGASIIKKAAETDPSFKTGCHADLTDDFPIPMSYNEMVTSYTLNERRALYDYVISKTKTFQVSETLSQMENNANIETGSRTSYLEEMAMLRDTKRRRTKYKVSTKAKSYTEIMREVIDNQMKTHCEWIKSTQDHRSSITESSTGQNSQNRIISKPRKKESHHHSSKNKSSEKHKPKHKHRKEKR